MPALSRHVTSYYYMGISLYPLIVIKSETNKICSNKVTEAINESDNDVMFSNPFSEIWDLQPGPISIKKFFTKKFKYF